MQSGNWMMNEYGRGFHGSAFGNQFGGGFDGFGPVSLFTISVLSVLFFLALLWTIAIKGYALWHAAKRNEKWWFIALLVVNTFGILELVYLFFFAKVFGRGDKGDKKEMTGSVSSSNEKSVEMAMNKDSKDAHQDHDSK